MTNSKKKGNKAERDASKVLENWTGKEFARIPASGGLRWHKREGVVGDLMCSTEGHYFPFTVEVKFHEKIDFSQPLFESRKGIKLLDFVNQALTDGKRASKEPMLLIRYNGMPKGVFFVGIRRTLLIRSKVRNLAFPNLTYGKPLNFVFFLSTYLNNIDYKKIHSTLTANRDVN